MLSEAACDGVTSVKRRYTWVGLGLLSSMLGPTYPLISRASLSQQPGIPPDSPLEGPSTWGFALLTLAKPGVADCI